MASTDGKEAPATPAPPAPPAPHPAAAPYEALDPVEADALRQRRAVAFARGGDVAAAQAMPRVGLALSGGGVRSATFAIGLIRGLAKGGLLNRIDFLSTVSGGGYAGAVFGRLVSLLGHEQAGRTLADDQSDTLDWLRRNGRYLTPSGSRDYGMALVTYLRALLAIHTEAMVACAMVGLLVIAPHLAHYSLQWFEVAGWQGWKTPWFAAATLLWLATGPGLIGAYWIARETRRPGLRDAGLALAFGAAALVPPMIGAARFVSTGFQQAPDWRSAVWMMLLSLALGIAGLWIWLHRQPADKHPLAVAEVRNALTRWLRAITLASLGLVALGVLDRLSWWMLELLATQGDLLWRGIGLGSIGVIALRVMAQPLQQVANEAGTHMKEWLPRAINLAGWLALAVLVMGWMVALQWFVFAPDTFGPNLDVPPWIRAAGVAATCALWLLLTAGNAQMANGSSLHSFYRARLVRAYLAVGNVRRGLDLAHADAVLREQAAVPLPRDLAGDVTRVVEGDDTALANYRPDAKGGPIHLITTCLNQTRDDRTSLYNADRKGSPLTVSAYGLEFERHAGQMQRVPLAEAPDVGNLGRWAAISGAAASPGAGSYTSRGLALLLYFLGVRLGHWVAAPLAVPPLRWLSDLGWRRLPKPLMLTSEAAAMFFGRERPWWYLSDGGHFENTGVYALLRRELDFIILSDASSDPDFEFQDIENLVRKARIDLGAEIDFYGKEAIDQALGGLKGTMAVLPPEDLGDQFSRRGVLLARVRYRRRGNAPRKQGTLLVVKPNLHQALDVDLLGYARKNPKFPHESTGDQSFDEAQWESYHRLGTDFGRALSDQWLRGVPGWLKPAQHENIVAARLQHALKKPANGADAAAVPATPAWRRTARAAAIGTTLGLGASGTLLLSLWQVQDQLQRSVQDQQKQARELFTQVSQDLQNFKGSCPKLAQHVIARTNLLFDLRGSNTLPKLERAGVDRLVAHVSEECARPADPSEECLVAQQAVYGDLCARLLRPATEDFAVNYWHPRSAPAEQWRTALAVVDRIGDALRGEAPGEHPVAVAAAPEPAPGSGGGAAAGGAVGAGAVVAAASGAGGGVDLGGLMAGMPSDAVEASADKARQLCTLFEIADGPTTLFMQVYDDPTAALASRLRTRLQGTLGDHLRVIEAENVNRSAELRGLRRPVPWPKPTFVIHDERNRPCAIELARFVREPWFAPGSTEAAWVRSLPMGMARRPGVIELWLPPPPNDTLMAIDAGNEPAR